MKTRSLIACCAALAFAAAMTAQHDCSVQAALLVQFGPGDIVLNGPLVEALVDDPDLADEILRLGGASVRTFRGIGVDLPAPHQAGTFQIHFNVNVEGPEATLPRASNEAIVNAVRGHVERRLAALLYDQPKTQLTARRDEMSRRLAELSRERAELRAHADEAAVGMSALSKVRESLAQQVLATSLDLATEQRAVSHLQVLRDRQSEERQRLEAHHREAAEQADLLQVDVGAITAEINSSQGTISPSKIKALQESCREVEQKLVQRRRDRESILARLEDANNLLAHTLEQLPTCTLALQRAQARAEALAAEQKRNEERAAAAAVRAREAAEFETRSERLQIDATVCRSLLTEIQGKLARLEPVRCELLRRR